MGGPFTRFTKEESAECVLKVRKLLKEGLKGKAIAMRLGISESKFYDMKARIFREDTKRGSA